MKKVLYVTSIMLLTLSCESKQKKEERIQKELQAQAKEFMKNRLDFSLDSTPKYFSEKTIHGKIFNSEDYKNKILVIFIYDHRSLDKSETFDQSTEVNTIFDQYSKKNINFIGIIEGFVDDENKLKQSIKNSTIKFDQIDNTKSFEKQEKIKYNIFCSPAKIVINEEGKVVFATCGGGNSEGISQLLDSLSLKTER